MWYKSFFLLLESPLMVMKKPYNNKYKLGFFTNNISRKCVANFYLNARAIIKRTDNEKSLTLTNKISKCVIQIHH